MEKLLQERKADIKLTIMHGVGHDSWTQTYATPENYEWLLRHRRVK
jgi:predicted peptidase